MNAVVERLKARGDTLSVEAAECITDLQLSLVRRTNIPWSDAHEIAQAGFDEWAAKDHNKKWFKRIDGTPIPNDVVVCIATAFAARYFPVSSFMRAEPEGGEQPVASPQSDGNIYGYAHDPADERADEERRAVTRPSPAPAATSEKHDV